MLLLAFKNELHVYPRFLKKPTSNNGWWYCLHDLVVYPRSNTPQGERKR